MDRIFRIGIVLLLGGILGLLVAIYLKIPNAPPTFGDLRTAKAREAKQSLYMKRPLVYVAGSVDIENMPTVDIGNTPIEVEISR